MSVTSAAPSCVTDMSKEFGHLKTVSAGHKSNAMNTQHCQAKGTTVNPIITGYLAYGNIGAFLTWA